MLQNDECSRPDVTKEQALKAAEGGLVAACWHATAVEAAKSKNSWKLHKVLKKKQDNK